MGVVLPVPSEYQFVIGFEVLAAVVTIKSVVFCDVTRCSPVDVQRNIL
jgi:hypothetical protein